MDSFAKTGTPAIP